MMKMLFVQPRATIGRVAKAAPVRALSCVWIETNNPRQPLACLWIDTEMRAFAASEHGQESQPAEDLTVPLRWSRAERLCA